MDGAEGCTRTKSIHSKEVLPSVFKQSASPPEFSALPQAAVTHSVEYVQWVPVMSRPFCSSGGLNLFCLSQN